MNLLEQREQFSNELWSLIERYRQESDIRYVDVIGILESAKLQMAISQSLQSATETDDQG